MSDSTRVTKKAPFPSSAAALSIEIQRERFFESSDAVTAGMYCGEGVGTLSEKSLHKILKRYIDSERSHYEVKHLGYVADIKNEEGIFEIQTRAYNNLKPKLSKLLDECTVTVVCPLAYRKSIIWVDPESGEASAKKKSPKNANIYDALFNLFQIRDYIQHENLRIKILFLECDEFRFLDGWDKSKKRGSNRMEMIPTDSLFELDIKTKDDYALFIPESLGEEFVAKEFQSEIGRTSRFTYYVLKLLCATGCIFECGKRGRAVLYSRNPKQKNDN